MKRESAKCKLECANVKIICAFLVFGIGRLLQLSYFFGKVASRAD